MNTTDHIPNPILLTFLKIFAGLGLVLTVLPAILVFSGTIQFNHHLILMTIGMVLWFAARIVWQYLDPGE